MMCDTSKIVFRITGPRVSSESRGHKYRSGEIRVVTGHQNSEFASGEGFQIMYYILHAVTLNFPILHCPYFNKERTDYRLVSH